MQKAVAAKFRKEKQGLFLAGFAIGIGYWLFRLSSLIRLEREEAYLGSLGLFLLSWTLVFGLVSILAWTNFRFVFTRWKEGRLSALQFWTIELFLMALVFEFFQWRTGHEETLIGENLLVTLFLGGYLLAFIWVAESVRLKRKQKLLIQQKEKAELKLLQSQLNPHFLFNALNTVYSSAVADGSDRTAEQIQSLAGMMRFATENAHKDTVSVAEELEFLTQYVQVQLNRLSAKQQEMVEWDVNWDGVACEICPMLIQPLIENGFKFSDFSTFSRGQLRIELSVEEKSLQFSCRNLFQVAHVQRNTGTGQGLALVRERLESLYSGKYELVVPQHPKEFTVHMSLQLV